LKEIKKANLGYFQHIGIYGFKSSVLDRISKLESSPLELTEQLEQLRWLENDMNIHLEITNIETPSVDCPKDLENLIKNYGSSL
jgi:3-deoxy-manno-octulosonate cytidylyltransferase (CMP-KDO synthetase)